MSKSIKTKKSFSIWLTFGIGIFVVICFEGVTLLILNSSRLFWHNLGYPPSGVAVGASSYADEIYIQTDNNEFYKIYTADGYPEWDMLVEAPENFVQGTSSCEKFRRTNIVDCANVDIVNGYGFIDFVVTSDGRVQYQKTDYNIHLATTLIITFCTPAILIGVVLVTIILYLAKGRNVKKTKVMNREAKQPSTACT
ncbi:MAG: hypothetical protein KA138_08180 [Saprospiraceae bacterium]|nr:hypothetical protein [Saprospiraceae bacterium]